MLMPFQMNLISQVQAKLTSLFLMLILTNIFVKIKVILMYFEYHLQVINFFFIITTTIIHYLNVFLYSSSST